MVNWYARSPEKPLKYKLVTIRTTENPLLNFREVPAALSTRQV